MSHSCQVDKLLSFVRRVDAVIYSANVMIVACLRYLLTEETCHLSLIIIASASSLHSQVLRKLDKDVALLVVLIICCPSHKKKWIQIQSCTHNYLKLNIAFCYIKHVKVKKKSMS